VPLFPYYKGIRAQQKRRTRATKGALSHRTIIPSKDPGVTFLWIDKLNFSTILTFYHTLIEEFP